MRKICISRRGFLRNAAGASLTAIGLPYLVPSSAMGKAGAVAPSERITLGFIGTGDHGRNVNIKNFLSNPPTSFPVKIKSNSVMPSKRNKAKTKIARNI